MKKQFKDILSILHRLHVLEFMLYVILSDVVLYFTLKYDLNDTLVCYINNCVLAFAFMHTWYIERHNLKVNIVNIDKMEEFYFKQLDSKYKLFLDRMENKK